MTDASTAVTADRITPDSLRVSDHVRPTDDVLAAGIYRVVGTTEDTVTLLRVSDGDGRRRHTGEVVTIDAEACQTLTVAENPDDNRSIGEQVRSTANDVLWSFRVFGRSLVAHPFQSVVALALLTFGRWGDGLISLPGIAGRLIAVAGILLLAYVGSQGAD